MIFSIFLAYWAIGIFISYLIFDSETFGGSTGVHTYLDLLVVVITGLVWPLLGILSGLVFIVQLPFWNKPFRK